MLSNVRYEGTLLAATVTVAAERARATRTACGSMSEPAVGSLASAGRSVDGHCQWNGHGHGTSLTRSRRSALSVSSGPRPDRDSAHPRRSRCSRPGQRTRTGHCGHSDAPPGPKRGVGGCRGAPAARHVATRMHQQTYGRARGAQLGAAAQPPPPGGRPARDSEVGLRWLAGPGGCFALALSLCRPLPRPRSRPRRARRRRQPRGQVWRYLIRMMPPTAGQRATEAQALMICNASLLALRH